MLDINLFRVDKGGNPDLIKASQKKRGAPVELVDEVITLDKEWIKLRFDMDANNKEAKALQLKIAEKMKAGEACDELKAERVAVVAKGEEIGKVMEEKHQRIQYLLANMGNIVHDSVVDSMDERNNNVVRTHGDKVKDPSRHLLPHHQVLTRLQGYDQDRGTKASGHRGYYLYDWGVRLNQALINYGLDFLRNREYRLVQTPFMLKKDMMGKCAQLGDYDEQLYRVVYNTQDPSEDRYLIATSEQPIACLHADEWFEEPAKQLPVRYAGYSTCFRKEAGSHGKDTWGLFRIHQFEKIEQFVLCEPEHSWRIFDEMIGTSEAFYQSLGLSYQVVGIVSGALNNAAAKKFDLEAWFPHLGDYKELVSCSNCTDYQARRLEIRCGMKKMGDREKRYVHCLNSTLCATERTLCCLLENYQTADGLEVPAVLRPYLGGVDFIPYSAPADLKRK